VPKLVAKKLKEQRPKGKPEMKEIPNRIFNLMFFGFPVGIVTYILVSTNSRIYICC